MELFIFIASLFLFLFLGIPIWQVLVLCSTVLMLYSGIGMDVLIIPQAMLDGSDNYALMAIPFFIFAGEIMSAGGLSVRVVRLAQLLVGRIRGGLGYAAIFASIIFATPSLKLTIWVNPIALIVFLISTSSPGICALSSTAKSAFASGPYVSSMISMYSFSGFDSVFATK